MPKEGVAKGPLQLDCCSSQEGKDVPRAAGDFWALPISCSTAGAAAVFSLGCFSLRSMAGCRSKLVIL